MRFHLDIQFFASKKGVGSTKNGRDSQLQTLADDYPKNIQVKKKEV